MHAAKSKDEHETLEMKAAPQMLSDEGPSSILGPDKPYALRLPGAKFRVPACDKVSD